MGWFHEIKQSKDQIKIRKGWITKCSSSSHPKKGVSLMSTQKAQRQKRLGIRGRAKMAKKQSSSNSYHHPFNKHHWSSIHRNHLQNQQQPLDRRSLSEHRMHDKEWKNTSDTRLWEKHGTEDVMRAWMNAYYIGVRRMDWDGSHRFWRWWGVPCLAEYSFKKTRELRQVPSPDLASRKHTQIFCKQIGACLGGITLGSEK